VFLGVPFNIASYSLFTHIIADICKLIPRRFILNLGDAHIYSNHVEQVNEQLLRTPLPFPKLLINSKNCIDDYTSSDFTINNYDYWPAIKAKMAV